MFHPKKINNKLLFKSNELPQKIYKTITIDNVEDEKSKSNECTSSVDDKSTSKNSNNLKNSSSTHKSKSNECSSSLGNNSKNSSSTQQSKSNDCYMSLE